MELKDALMQNVQALLMELGRGFAFVGREYRLVVGKTEQFIDYSDKRIIPRYSFISSGCLYLQAS